MSLCQLALVTSQTKVHCKEKMPKTGCKYSQKRNIGASETISTFMCLRANYIFPRWSCRFCWRKYVDQPWEYINRSQTHECGNWGWGRAIPRKGIYKRNCRCSVVVPFQCSPAGGCAGLRQQDPAALRLHQRQGRGLSVPGRERQGFQ